MNQQVYQRNIFKLYAHSFSTMFLIIIPVIVPLFQMKGLNMQRVFELQAFFAVIVAIMEVPSGYFSDLFGRKLTLILAGLFHGTGYTILHFADSTFDLFLFEGIVAIGVSFFSGTNVSLIYDSYNKLEHKEKSSSQVMGSLQLALRLSETIAALVASAIVIKGLHRITLIQAIIGWLPMLFAMTLSDIPIERMSKKEHYKNFKEILHFIFKENKLIRLTFINYVAWGLSTFFAVWIFQKYWFDNKISLIHFGYIWAVYNITVGIVGKYAHRIENYLSPRQLILTICILPIIGYFSLALLSGWVAIILGLCFQLSRGLTQVILKDALNSRIPAKSRATVNSLGSLFFRLIFFIFGPFIGWIIDHKGVSFALFSIGCSFIILIFILALPLALEIKSIHSQRQS